MSIVAADCPLGPQCLRCRRRRVKCDSAPETCRRCIRDGYDDCPGYEKKTKWKVFTPDAMGRPGARKTLASRQHDMAGSASFSSTSSGRTTSPASQASSTDVVIPASLILSTIEKEIVEIQSSIMYYNETLVPDLAASPVPSETILVPLDVWVEKSPKVLHHIIVTIVTCHQLACNGSAHGVPHSNDDTQLADTVNRHRSRGIMQLQRLLSDFWQGSGSQAVLTKDQVKIKGLVTLVAVVLLLTQEVQMSATSLWSMHLEAARSLVNQLGGFENFWSSQVLHQGMFVLYLMVDIMSPSTSPAWSINGGQQRAYLAAIPRLEGLERRLIASFQPIPLPVLQAVVQTNILRTSLHREASDDGHMTGLAFPEDGHQNRVFAITLASLLRFDSKAWAHRVCAEYLELTHPRPPHDDDEKAWSALAKAYQGAALIYLLRSTEHVHYRTAPGVAGDTEALLSEHRDAVDATLALLCKDLTRTKSSRALWRFLGWPLFIHAYEVVGWSAVPDVSAPSPPGEVGDDAQISCTLGHVPPPPKAFTTALHRLERVARRMGANSLFEGAELLEGVWRKRCARRSTIAGGIGVGDDATWRWDDGFEGRCVFVV